MKSWCLLFACGVFLATAQVITSNYAGLNPVYGSYHPNPTGGLELGVGLLLLLLVLGSAGFGNNNGNSGGVTVIVPGSGSGTGDGSNGGNTPPF